MIWIEREEDYYKITEKTASFLYLVDILTTKLGLEYLYAFKTDDDAYVSLDRLEERLTSLSKQYKAPPQLWGICNPSDVEVNRDESSKFFTPESSYPEDYYPVYCQGCGYAMSRDLVHCVAGEIPQIRYMQYEDVFAGLLARRCNVTSVFDEESEFVRQFRSGWKNGDTAEERRRIRNNEGKLTQDDLDWLPQAELGPRIVQHHVVNDEDMRRYHNSIDKKIRD